MKIRQLYAITRQAVSAWADDYAPSMGAALAYYTLFSIAPLLLIVVSVAGLVFGEDAARGQVVAELRGLMGEAGASAIQSLLQNVNKPSQGVIGTIVGVGTLLLGAMTVFGELQDALDRIWRAPARAQASGLWSLVHSRLLSFGMVLGLGFLLIVSLVASAAIAAIGKFAVAGFPWWAIVVEVLNFLLSFALVTLMFAMIYKIMPRVRIAWRDVWVGAAATALLFAIGKFLIGLYIGRSSFASAYGAASSLIVVLLWMYYSAQIFLLGAEFTWVYAHVLGSCRDAPAPAPAPQIPTRSAAMDETEASNPVERSRASIAAALKRARGRG
ncbi:MAG TPA: YihY/virulence factor BrkB family protein [Caldimonas sp.]|jgi:membrane protein|nr:YihY/virulence factor BrkB family protein [Caldimonas sp.]HEX2542751.1 YihY/virulence factor BrkB family protein [Caldimonas sp.]